MYLFSSAKGLSIHWGFMRQPSNFSTINWFTATLIRKCFSWASALSLHMIIHWRTDEFNLKLDWISFPILPCAQVLEQPDLTGPASTSCTPDTPPNPNISMTAAKDCAKDCLAEVRTRVPQSQTFATSNQWKQVSLWTFHHKIYTMEMSWYLELSFISEAVFPNSFIDV